MRGIDDTVKVGDEIVVYGRDRLTRGKGPELVRVERVTKTLVFAGGDTYTKRTGRAHGRGPWLQGWCEMATDENRRHAAQCMAEAAMRARLDAAQRGVTSVRVTKTNLEAVETFLASLT